MLLSVVIITRNEEKNIVDCVRSAKQVSSDIIIVDAGSSDATVSLAAGEGARTFPISWKGYGYSRNYGAELALHDWILALDADERLSTELVHAIQHCTATEGMQYGFRRKNFLGSKALRFGHAGFDQVVRIYNRRFASWDLKLVHEQLLCGRKEKKRLGGHLVHYGMKDPSDYRSKAEVYALLSAEKYFEEGKRPGPFKRYASPFFNSLKSYIFQLGFLDGRNGWISAKTLAYYCWLKYTYLQQFHEEQEENDFCLTGQLETDLH